MIKRFFASLACVCLFAAALTVGALAASPIYIGGKQLNGSDSSPAYATTDTTGAVTIEEDFGENDPWNIKWDGETLTLNGARITQGGHNDAAIYCNSNLTIVLEGANTVAWPENTIGRYGIYGDSLTIDGDGSLNVSGGEAVSSYGIYAEGDVSINAGTVNAKGGDCEKDVDGSSYGIYAKGSVTISSGMVTATGGYLNTVSPLASCGIYSDSSVTISGGVVEANGGDIYCDYGTVYEGRMESSGISASEVKITDGEVTASGGNFTGYLNPSAYGHTNYLYFCGINGRGIVDGVTISGGTVTANGGTFAAGTELSIIINSCGVSSESQVTISGGVVTANGSTISSGTSGLATNNSRGINSKSSVVISGGTVEAMGDNAAANNCTIQVDQDTGIEVLANEEKNAEGAKEISSYGDLGKYKYLKITIADKANIHVGGVGLYGDKESGAIAYAKTDATTGAVSKCESAEGATIIWDGETLTLDGARITQGGHNGAAIYCNSNLTIVLEGANTVAGPENTGGSYGIYGGSLTIDGDGSLNVSGGNSGINASNVTISGGTVEAAGRTSGAAVTGSLTVSPKTGDQIAVSTLAQLQYNADDGSLNWDAMSDAATEIEGSPFVTETSIQTSGQYFNSTVGEARYTVKLEPNGGTIAEGKDVTSYTYGVGATLPTEDDITRTGYTFDGWYDNAELSGSPVTEITATDVGDKEFYAKWEPVTYTVTFDSNGGSGTMSAQTFVYDEEKALTANSFTRAGYSFAGWNTAADGSGTDYADGAAVKNLRSEAGSVTLYAKWTASDYSVTLHANGGTIADAASVTSYTYGVGAALPGEGEIWRSGYRFGGWYADEDFTDGPYTQISAADLGDKVFYARWERTANLPDTYEIVIDEDISGGSIRPSLFNASAGTVITFTVTPDEGQELVYITVDGERIDGASFTMPARDVTVSAYFAPSGGLPFTDVSRGDWFYEYVAYVYENGLMDGVSDTLFDPNGEVTRAQLVTILWRLDGEPVVNYALPFDDVSGGEWYTEAVRWAASEGIVNGVSETSFAPGTAVTREQFASILYRYAQYKGYDVSAGEDTNILSYTDFASISEYAIEALQWACGDGIITGVSDSTLTPQGTATRAQAAAMLMRFVEGTGE